MMNFIKKLNFAQKKEIEKKQSCRRKN